MRDRVDLADGGEELVAEAFALGRAAHQAGDVDEGQPRRDDLRGFGDRRQLIEPRIRHRDFADIRLDGAERIVRRLRRRGLGQRVEQRRFADIGQADDAAFESHECPEVRCVAVRRRVTPRRHRPSRKTFGLHRQMHLVLERRVPVASRAGRHCRRPPRTAPRPRAVAPWRNPTARGCAPNL